MKVVPPARIPANEVVVRVFSPEISRAAVTSSAGGEAGKDIARVFCFS